MVFPASWILKSNSMPRGPAAVLQCLISAAAGAAAATNNSTPVGVTPQQLLQPWWPSEPSNDMLLLLLLLLLKRKRYLLTPIWSSIICAAADIYAKPSQLHCMFTAHLLRSTITNPQQCLTLCCSQLCGLTHLANIPVTNS
jgi:hypothetical protein